MLQALTLVCAVLAPSELDWQYRVLPEGDRLYRPPLRAVPLGTAAPDDVRVDVVFEGTWQRFGVLRYGDADSRRVTIALDHLGGERVALYVDTGRDLVLDATDRAQEIAPGRFVVDLAVETRAVDEADGASDAPQTTVSLTQPLMGPRRTPRRVELELGRTGTILGCATLGVVEGEVQLGDRRVRVLRRDGDANGLLSDDQDQLWFDLDADGVWEPLSELFLVQPILSIAGGRFACRSDRLGTTLALDAIEGTGRVSITPPPGVEAKAIVDAEIVLIGRDGASVVARAPGEPVEVPVGDYRIGTVTLRLADPKGGAPWSYVFTDDRGEARAKWRAVEDDQTLALDPIGALEFRIALRGSDEALAPGGSGALQLVLRTGDGLLVVTCYRGREGSSPYSSAGLHAVVEVTDLEGEVLKTATSGFA
jgi:hypothetical protein